VARVPARIGETVVAVVVLRVLVDLPADPGPLQGLARAGRGAGGDAAEFEDDGAALSMVSGGLGTTITPRLSLEGVPDDVGITDLGPERPSRSFGCLTVPEQARSLAVRALIRELRVGDAKPPSQIVGSPSNCGDRPAGLP
jgi:DNA-binding transcriptional LysR family regulator